MKSSCFLTYSYSILLVLTGVTNTTLQIFDFFFFNIELLSPVQTQKILQIPAPKKGVRTKLNINF